MKDLEFLAISFLRFEKRCPVALTERSPRPHHGRPDVLGVTKDRYLLEIEVKRSMAASARLKIRECVELAHCMANQIYSFLLASDRAKECRDGEGEYQI